MVYKWSKNSLQMCWNTYKAHCVLAGESPLAWSGNYFPILATLYSLVQKNFCSVATRARMCPPPSHV